LIVLVLASAGCASPLTDTGGGVVDAGQGLADTGHAEPDAGVTVRPLTWHGVIEPLFERRCVGCHRTGEAAPFVLDDYATAHAMRMEIAAAVEDGSMPPWQPGEGCNDYAHDERLSDSEVDTVLNWVLAGAPEGDPSQAPEGDLPTNVPGLSRVDLTLGMTEPWTPRESPDDYRCFLIDWPYETPKFVTGFRADPGNRTLVHHVIAFMADPELVDKFEGMDAADPEAGYTCFGGPGDLNRGVHWMGSWAPGGMGYDLPEGTGIAVAPGSKLIVQVHYSTLENPPSPDQTSVSFKIEDSVDKRAMWMPWTNPSWVSGQGMEIPAGEGDVRHQWALDPTAYGLPFDNSAFDIHLVALHMHLLGSSARLDILRREGGDDDTCLLHIPRWDFDWQGGALLAQPVRFHPGDRLRVACQWDNSQANQPPVNGVQPVTQDVAWGEGTRDEMCLGLAYVAEL
jgi:hypothetical protein